MQFLSAYEGETADGALHRATGLGPAALPALFAANPRLCERVTLDAGERVFLPATLISAPASTPTRARVQLWD